MIYWRMFFPAWCQQMGFQRGSVHFDWDGLSVWKPGGVNGVDGADFYRVLHCELTDKLVHIV